MEALEAAFNSGTPIGILALDGPRATAGSKGFRVDVKVTQFGRGEPLDGPTVIPITLKSTTADGHELEPVTMS